MRAKHELRFLPGLIVNQEFFDYAALQESAKNWLYLLKCRLGTGPFYGRHDGVQLNNLQFGHADRHEGMMFEGYSPKECLTIAIMQKGTGSTYLNRLKMKPGDIIVIDDAKPYDFVSSHHTVIAIVSIHKTLVAAEMPSLLSATDKKFKDSGNRFSEMIEHEWKRATETPGLFEDPCEIDEMERRIVHAVKETLSGQKGVGPQLTEGEKTALEIKSFLLDSLQETVTIKSITERFNVSDKTLESSFKALFGITPKRFKYLLRLNHAHEELQNADKETTNVSDIAMKWGFLHFGRFSKDYKALFGVLPSESLKRTSAQL